MNMTLIEQYVRCQSEASQLKKYPLTTPYSHQEMFRIVSLMHFGLFNNSYRYRKVVTNITPEC